jgi:hypothetical protein
MENMNGRGPGSLKRKKAKLSTKERKNKSF